MGRLNLEPDARFALCESVTAGSCSPWHIRAIPAGEKPKFGGGITTGCLCGHVKAHNGWDLDVKITERHLDGKTVAGKCGDLYRVATRKEPQYHEGSVVRATARMEEAKRGAEEEAASRTTADRAMYCDGTAHGLREALRMLEEELRR